MIPIEIEINERLAVIDLPESWDEVPKERLPVFLELVTRPMGERKKITRLLSAYGFRKRDLKKLALFELREIMKPLSWLNEPWKERRAMMPSIGVFNGLHDGMERLAFNQLIMAGIFCDNADELQEANAGRRSVRRELEKMCAILYTPFGIRYRYSLHKLYKWYFRFVPSWKLASASISWRAQRAWLAEKYPLTHNQSGDGDSHGPYGLIVTLAGEKFGKVEQVHYAEVRYVFTYLEQSAEQAAKLKNK
jgi:hypothetical protein